MLGWLPQVSEIFTFHFQKLGLGCATAVDNPNPFVNPTHQMLTKAQIAADFGVSHQYVSKLVKKGLPLDSYEAAREWKNAHASQRAPTHSAGIARQLIEEKDDDSPEARERRKKYFEDKPDDARLPSENPLDDALDGVAQAFNESLRLLKEAMIEGRDNKIGVRLAVFNKAAEGLFRAEQSHREELERRRVLIPLAEAQDMARKGYDIILSRLAALPQNVAVRCNPHEPHRAMEALQEECTAIVANAQGVYAAV